MKKRLAIFLLILCNSTFPATQHPQWQTVEINTNQVKVEVAQTDQELQTGLMGRTSLPANQGMLFLIHSSDPITFWMYHTLIPLDMLFIKNGKIIKISDNVPPCTSEDALDCPEYPDNQGVRVDQVLEVNSGYAKAHHIRAGDRVNLIK